MTKMRETLTVKQAKFLESYAICLNASKAAIAAGYSPKHIDKVAHQLVHHPLIKKELEKFREKNIQKASVTFQDVVNLLWHVANKNKDSERDDISIKAVTEINKMYGYYSPEKSYNVNINENREVKEIQEIRAMYKKDI